MHIKFKALLIIAIVMPMTACAADTQPNRTGAGGTLHSQSLTPAARKSVESRFNRWDNVRNNNWVSAHSNTEIEMSPVIAERIQLLPQVDRAYVALTDINAYAAIVPQHPSRANEPLNAGLKKQITEQVRSLHPGTREVFVSKDPNFVARLKTYDEQARQGKPLRGVLLRFNAAMERLFPTPDTTR